MRSGIYEVEKGVFLQKGPVYQPRLLRSVILKPSFPRIHGRNDPVFCRKSREEAPFRHVKWYNGYHPLNGDDP